MRDLSGQLQKFRETGDRQREIWLQQHLHDFVAGLVRHGFDAEMEQRADGIIDLKVYGPRDVSFENVSFEVVE
jgi:hypothetical protein